MKKNFFSTYKSPLSLVIVLIILGGMFSYSRLHTSLFPEITFPKIKIIADAGELPVDQMMLTVTRPMELAIKKVPSLKNLRSSTSRGSCEISALMDWNSDIDLDLQRIESKISEIRHDLPCLDSVTCGNRSTSKIDLTIIDGVIGTLDVCSKDK